MTKPTQSTTRRVMTVGFGLVIVFATAAAVAAGAWFGSETVRGNGVIRPQDRPLGRFSGIEMSVPAELEVRIGATESVRVETDENVLPLVDTKVENGVLQVRAARRNLNLATTSLKILVTAREIRHLSIGGGGSIVAANLKTPKLKLEIGGSGTMDVRQVEADAIDTDIGGSGNIKLAGQAGKLSVSIAGSGDVSAQQLRADSVEVSIAGSGSATLWPVNALSASIAGSGDVHYWGDPKSNSSSIAGSGKIRRAGP